MSRLLPPKLPLASSRTPVLGTGWEDLTNATSLCNVILGGSERAVQDRNFHVLAVFFLTNEYVETMEFDPPKDKLEQRSILSTILSRGNSGLRGFGLSRIAHANAEESDGPLGSDLFPDLVLSWVEWFENQKETVLGRSEILIGTGGHIAGFGNRIIECIDRIDHQRIVEILRGEV